MDGKGDTPLHSAVLVRLEMVVESLLEKNLDVAIMNNNGKTALHSVIERGREEIVSLLREKQVPEQVQA